MSAFGDIFRSGGLEGVEENDENGERGTVVGLDLDQGVVHIRTTRSSPRHASGEDLGDGPPGVDGDAGAPAEDP